MRRIVCRKRRINLSISNSLPFFGFVWEELGVPGFELSTNDGSMGSTENLACY